MSTEVKKISLHHHAQILFWDIIIHLLSQSKLLRRCIQIIFPHKKIILTIFYILIAGCIIAGLINIPTVNATLSAKAPIFPSKAGCTSPQCNYIVVHASQIDDEQPELISIWMVFITKTDNHQIIWKKISPKELPALENIAENTPLISPEGNLSKELVNNINSLEIHWDGYFIIDDFTADQLMYWITGKKRQIKQYGWE